MKKFIVKQLVNVWEDFERPLPQWVCRFIDNDDELSQLLDQHRRLTGQLRSGARILNKAKVKAADQFDTPKSVLMNRVVRSASNTQETIPTASRTRRQRMIALATVATILLATFGGWYWSSFAKLESDRVRPLAQGGGDHSGTKQTQESFDLTAMVASLSAGQEVTRRVVVGSRAAWSKIAALPKTLDLDEQLDRAEHAGQEIRQTGQQLGSALSDFSRFLTPTNQPQPRS